MYKWTRTHLLVERLVVGLAKGDVAPVVVVVLIRWWEGIEVWSFVVVLIGEEV